MLVWQWQSRIDAIRQVQIGNKRIIFGASSAAARGMDQLKELKRVQKENERLRRGGSALTLGEFILSEVAKGKF